MTKKLNHKKSIIIGLLIALVLAIVVGVLGYEYKMNEPQVRVAKMSKQTPPHKQITDNPKGKHYYGISASIPDLDQLQKLRDQSPNNLTLRGYVLIPSLKIELPIYEGTAPQTLAWGAGTALPNEQMGQNNFAIEAHNMLQLSWCRNWFFSNFQTQIAPYGEGDKASATSYIKAKNGEAIYAVGQNKVYKYVIKNSQIVDANNPNSGAVLTKANMANFGNKPIITMTTCFIQKGIDHPSQRIVVTGVLNKTISKSAYNHGKR